MHPELMKALMQERIRQLQSEANAFRKARKARRG